MSDELTRARFTFYTVLTAFGVLLIAFLVTVFVFKGATNPGETIPAVLGTVTGVLGTLAGYVAGQKGKEEAEIKATKAQKQLSAFQMAVDPDVAVEVRRHNAALFD
ncbi:MAG: hypothetical protein WD801_11500 [Gemmatimonadaceae bacterium]